MLLGLAALFIVLLVKRIRKKPQETDSNIDKVILDILPFADYSLEYDLYQLKDGSCMDLIQIRTKDLLSESTDSIEYDKLHFWKLHKKYSDDIKLIAMNYPSNTQKQQQYFSYKAEKTKNEVFKKALTETAMECVWIEKHRTTREYYFLIWGINPEDLIKKRDLVIDTLGDGREGLCIVMNEDKKTEICYKLDNKNTEILRRRGENE